MAEETYPLIKKGREEEEEDGPPVPFAPRKRRGQYVVALRKVIAGREANDQKSGITRAMTSSWSPGRDTKSP